MRIPILIVGADSAIGGAMMRELSQRGHRSVGTSRRTASRHLYLDLMKPELPELNNVKPGKAVLAASMTNISYCDSNPAESYAVNVAGTKVLIQNLVERGWKILFLSTADVFSNQKQPISLDAKPNPISVYGQQKREVETFIASVKENCGVVRLTKVIGPRTEPFFTWIRALRQQKTIEAVDKKLIAPLSLRKASSEICDLLLSDMKGLWHLGGSQILSYPEIAKYLSASVSSRSRIIETPQESNSPEWAVFASSLGSTKCRIVAETLDDVFNDLLNQSKVSSF